MPSGDFSFMQVTWYRLKKNRLAFTGLLVIVVTILISIFGYLFAPDNSPFADNQTVEIQAKKPGYTQLFLKIPKQETVKVGWLKKLMSGTPSAYTYIPITGYSIQGGKILVEKYVDEDTTVKQLYAIN